MKRIIFWGFLFLLFQLSIAGWVMTDEDGSKTLISDGKMKTRWEDGAMILDGRTGQLIMINSQEAIFARGRIKDYCQAIHSSFDKMMASLPEEQREMMKQFMGMDESAPAKEIVIKKAGKGKEIAGMETVVYDVMVDGQLYEKVWVSEVPQLVEDFKPMIASLKKFMGCGQSLGGGSAVETDPAYLALFEKGVALKSVDHESDPPETDTLIRSLEQTDLPDSEFQPPSGYTKVPFGALMQIEME